MVIKAVSSCENHIKNKEVYHISQAVDFTD